ncbi:MAG: CDP-glucose 4,6-dehydratase [Ruminococcaceae bacterium]|nr:CDP-glucose 4,6-dehydratase [Oscillospiraceae bacterium]
MDLSFYSKRRVLVTGHTGFKGAWLCKMLTLLGAEVTGYALEPPTNPNLFDMLSLSVDSVIGDIRDFDKLKSVFDKAQPEVVIHLAAQPIVRDSYKLPRYTYDTNVMGTVNVCECVRLTPSVKSFLNVTTDKVYENEDLNIAFTEDMKLDGYDPYSNSKSCSELVTHSYQKSFFKSQGVAVSTARAGNVIGGGDFANDRIVPDSVRAVISGNEIVVRNPYSTRPFQHVLEPLYAYLLIAMRQYENGEYADCYNVGPDDCDCITTGELCDLFCSYYGGGAKWKNVSEQNAVHEAGFLRLDTSKLKSTFAWQPVWNIKTALQKVVEWTKVYADGGDVDAECTKQINEFLESVN